MMTDRIRGMLAPYRGFLLMAHDDGSDCYHCFIGMDGDHPMAKIPARIIWDNDKVRIRSVLWSSMDGPVPDGQWNFRGRRREGFLRWFGFDEAPVWDESVFCDFDTALDHLRVAADALCEATDRICGAGTSAALEEGEGLVEVGRGMAASLNLRWHENLSGLDGRLRSGRRRLRELMKMFECEDD